MQLLHIKPVENVNLDQNQLGGLYSQLGPAGAEDVLCRALEELSLRLSQSEELYRQGQWHELRRNTRSLIAIADQIGMQALSRVANDVIRCIDQTNGVAIAATLSRLMRVGDRSLSAIWESQDVTI
ncbi:hypothetical protein OS190_00615 [Sulfitobacter sp. F26204]|uniref:hypothetical protein n=1 Tax=Sulfitobacter sp. F26204 TaxID=2996014 RepID=UPI00225E3788|nr:hypothetical protein [Sulfitobacter sp. F26204]MCX7558049.1 hypothetical protein [Sulfitobacter sp. F26204]